MERRFEYPDLPVVRRRDDFLALLKAHPVVVVRGETGSGKTTQIPKFCLEAGLAETGKIACTQPRRIAALTVADRIRQECGDPDLVQCRIRLRTEGPDEAPLHLMTEGVLLQEFRRDPRLRRYSCLMLDEAHERTIDMDVLLGIARKISRERRNFRVVVASATLDAGRFSAFFDDAPVLEVEGRGFPVEIRYRDPEEEPEQDMLRRARNAIRDLMATRRDHALCFLPTERDIRELAELLSGEEFEECAVLPLFGRMSPEQQRAVFAPSRKPKIVLATNVAETSLTIPGIAAVVDTGLARIARYQPSSRIAALPVEPISKASAAQRAGRAGRVKPGICVRLYSERDFESRDEWTEPEILRSNLADAVLRFQRNHLQLATFPLLDPPPRSTVRDAYRRLYELGALESAADDARITPHGHAILRYPIDVTLAHVMIEAAKRKVLRPAVVVCAALSLQDPRVTPDDEKERARALQARAPANDANSDFVGILKLWNLVLDLCPAGSSQSKLRKACKALYLSYPRTREWIDLVEMFLRMGDEAEIAGRRRPDGPRESRPAAKAGPIDVERLNSDELHKALLSGFLDYVARRAPETGSYRTANGRETFVHPSSRLKRCKSEWIFAAELRETSRAWLSHVAVFKPEWIAEVAPHLCKTHYDMPHFNPKTGFVEAARRVVFKGFQIDLSGRVHYGDVDPEESSRVFWHEGAACGELPGRWKFLEANAEVLRELSDWQEKSRSSALPDEFEIGRWYHSRAPEVYSVPTLEEFVRRRGDRALRFSRDTWTGGAARPIARNREPFPEKARIGGENARISYVYDFRDPKDGATISLSADSFVRSAWTEWAFAVPGWMDRLREEVARNLPAAVAEKAELKAETLQAKWEENLRAADCVSFAGALGEALMEILGPEESRWTFARKWPAHLSLHVRVELPSGDAEEFDLSPLSGPATFLDRRKEILDRLWRLAEIGKAEGSEFPLIDPSPAGTGEVFLACAADGTWVWQRSRALAGEVHAWRAQRVARKAVPTWRNLMERIAAAKANNAPSRRELDEYKHHWRSLRNVFRARLSPDPENPIALPEPLREPIAKLEKCADPEEGHELYWTAMREMEPLVAAFLRSPEHAPRGKAGAIPPPKAELAETADAAPARGKNSGKGKPAGAEREPAPQAITPEALARLRARFRG